MFGQWDYWVIVYIQSSKQQTRSVWLRLFIEHAGNKTLLLSFYMLFFLINRKMQINMNLHQKNDKNVYMQQLWKQD